MANWFAYVVPTNANTIMVVFGYALSSSLLTIVNKYAVWVFPYPAALTALQYLVSAVTVALGGLFRMVDPNPLQTSTLRKFLPAALTFYISIYTNTELLKHANVETFIVFRSSTPLLVAVGETLFLGRPWPRARTFFSLAVILIGAIGYMFSDSNFSVTAYSWAFAYFFTITFDMLYIKHVTNTIGLNTWGLVLYNNLEALVFFPPTAFLMGEFSEFATHDIWDFLSPNISSPVALSCFLGLTISYFGFACRTEVSATAFTVLGVTNKLLTILINILLWDKHATSLGIFFLLLTILGGVLYQNSVSNPPDAKTGGRMKSGNEEEGSPGNYRPLITPSQSAR